LEKLEYLRNKFESIGRKEDILNNEMYKFKPMEKNLNELFKEEIERYKINDESFNEN
jgi:hypothetical protein